MSLPRAGVLLSAVGWAAFGQTYTISTFAGGLPMNVPGTSASLNGPQAVTVAGRAFAGAAPTNSPVSVTIGGVRANVAFAGITEAGLYQINVTVPNAPSGDQALQATVNGVGSPPGPVVTIQ